MLSSAVPAGLDGPLREPWALGPWMGLGSLGRPCCETCAILLWPVWSESCCRCISVQPYSLLTRVWPPGPLQGPSCGPRARALSGDSSDPCTRPHGCRCHQGPRAHTSPPQSTPALDHRAQWMSLEESTAMAAGTPGHLTREAPASEAALDSRPAAAGRPEQTHLRRHGEGVVPASPGGFAAGFLASHTRQPRCLPVEVASRPP